MAVGIVSVFLVVGGIVIMVIASALCAVAWSEPALVVFRIPTGVRAWIEDVVVDDAARGHGVGEALNQFALGLARDKGAKTVDLTSRPSREAANRLYQRIGFQPRETNVYRFSLEMGDDHSTPPQAS